MRGRILTLLIAKIYVELYISIVVITHRDNLDDWPSVTKLWSTGSVCVCVCVSHGARLWTRTEYTVDRETALSAGRQVRYGWSSRPTSIKHLQTATTTHFTLASLSRTSISFSFSHATDLIDLHSDNYVRARHSACHHSATLLAPEQHFQSTNPQSLFSADWCRLHDERSRWLLALSLSLDQLHTYVWPGTHWRQSRIRHCRSQQSQLQLCRLRQNRLCRIRLCCQCVLPGLCLSWSSAAVSEWVSVLPGLCLFLCRTCHWSVTMMSPLVTSHARHASSDRAASSARCGWRAGTHTAVCACGPNRVSESDLTQWRHRPTTYNCDLHS